MTEEEQELHELSADDELIHMVKTARVIKARRAQVAWCGGYRLPAPTGDGVPRNMTRIINGVTCQACATRWTDNVNALFGDSPETALLQQAVKGLEQHQADPLAKVPGIRVWRPSEHFKPVADIHEDGTIAEIPEKPPLNYLQDQPPAASEYGLGLPGARPRDIDLGEPGPIVQLPGVTAIYHGPRRDRGIFLDPQEWNIEPLPKREQQLLGYFFKLIYMERVRQIKKWGDQRRPDGVDFNTYHPASVLQKQRVEDQLRRGKATWIDVLLEEVYEAAECDPVVGSEQVMRGSRGGVGEHERDLEKEMVQSAAVLAAWFSDLCRRTEEIMAGVEGEGKVEKSLDEGMEGM